MGQLEAVIDRAEQQCAERGQRLTPKRKQVLQGLLQSGRALSAYELVDVCKDMFDQSMPAMSVYRILDFLEEQRLVHKLKMVNRYVACAHITCDHSHGEPQFLICSGCNRVDEIRPDAEIVRLLREDIEAAGFHLPSPQLEINCICHDCWQDESSAGSDTKH
ncbi:MAG: Fur family transcriptional regulator [Halieaceae bacterium]|jgi:Fur family zinc uptake transcriptional regulator|nr:Fur family transcriptional regulator [Halieaceae bacterium]